MIKNVEIETQNIKLDQFLKWANIVSSGGEAKINISSGRVTVNGQVEYRRGFLLSEGDLVELEQEGCYKVVPTKE